MAMATETETLTATEVKRAMGTLRLENWTEDLLDEIKLDRELAISIAEADRGETFPIEQLEKEVMEKFASGYYGRK
ncbi:hypothetical protein R83H12_01751 [Fibrobacteria bacterium R8-3-H12]